MTDFAQADRIADEMETVPMLTDKDLAIRAALKAQRDAQRAARTAAPLAPTAAMTWQDEKNLSFAELATGN